MRLVLNSVMALCLLGMVSCFAKPCAWGLRSQAAREQEESTTRLQAFEWESYEKAIRQSKKDKKPIGLFFTGSDWCIWCTKMGQQFEASSEFNQYVRDHVHMVEVDLPRNKEQTQELKDLNLKLKQKYGINGVPTLVLIDADGKEYVRFGYDNGGCSVYVQKMQDALRK